MVKQARKMVAENQFGNIRKVMVEYPQGWLSTLTEKDGNKQAAWRTDPEKSGAVVWEILEHTQHSLLNIFLV
jgi:predicted dehydrogenase